MEDRGRGNGQELSGSDVTVHRVRSTSDIRALLREALEQFDHPTNAVSASARRALRIAALRRDYVNQLWLQWELTDLTATKAQKWQDPAIQRIKDQLRALLGVEESRDEEIGAYLQFERNRSFSEGGKNRVIVHSLGQIEQSLAMSRRVYDDLTVPTNLAPLDTYYVNRDMDHAKAKMLPGIHQDYLVLERAKTAIHSFLITTEAELDEGRQESAVFRRAQEYLNGALLNYSPSALEKFMAAQDRVYSGNPEDLAHALTSCRRMIKALADSLYPPTDVTITGNDGIARTMSDDMYRNRLLQYVREKVGGHSHGTVLQKTLDSLGARLQSLDSLASKGVHDDVSAAEAETCIVWTYLLAADIVRIADGTSALLAQAADDQAPA